MEIKKGQIVYVTNSGETYTSYEEFMQEFGSDREKEIWLDGGCAYNYFVGAVVYVGKHLTRQSEKLAIVSDGDECYIIGVNGLRALYTEDNKMVCNNSLSIEQSKTLLRCADYLYNHQTDLIESLR